MKDFIRNNILIAIVLFFFGHVLVFIGLNSGQQMAIDFSRPSGADGWITSDEMIRAFTYVPAILGVSLIIMGLVMGIIVYYHWFKLKINEAGVDNEENKE